LQVDVVLVDLEVTNAMRAIQDTIRVEFSRAAIDAAVEELFKSEFGVANDAFRLGRSRTTTCPLKALVQQMFCEGIAAHHLHRNGG
jgi:hypothetical protein